MACGKKHVGKKNTGKKVAMAPRPKTKPSPKKDKGGSKKA